MSLNKIFIILTSLLFFSSNLYAENKVAYINIDLILSKSIPSKSLLSQLELIEQKQIDKIKNNETKLKEEEKKIFATKNIISKEEFNKNIDVFKKKVESHRKSKEKNIQNLKKKEIKKFYVFLNL